MTKTLVIAALAVLITSCANSPARLSLMSPEELTEIDAVALCSAYAFGRSDKIRDALLVRDEELRQMAEAGLPDPSGLPLRPAFTEREWQAIDAGSLYIGMSEMGMICSLGFPSIFNNGAVNTTRTASGVSKQYVYGRNYVYVRNGYVYGMQN